MQFEVIFSAPLKSPAYATGASLMSCTLHNTTTVSFTLFSLDEWGRHSDSCSVRKELRVANYFLTCPLSFFPFSWNRIKSRPASRTHTIHACVAHAKSAKQFINDAWRSKERSETRSHVHSAPLSSKGAWQRARGARVAPRRRRTPSKKATNTLTPPPAADSYCGGGCDAGVNLEGRL